MRIPKTSRRPFEPLEELYLGRGDYVAGGARSLPFLDLDGARRRRPLVFGIVTDDLDSCPAIAAEMFSGRQADPEEWAVMWKELGADGVALDVHGDPDLVRRVSDRTRLPVVVMGDTSGSLPSSDESVMIVTGDGVSGTGHAVTATGSTAEEVSAECGRLESSGEERIVILVEGFGIGPGLSEDVSLVRDIRARARQGHPRQGPRRGPEPAPSRDGRRVRMLEPRVRGRQAGVYAGGGVRPGRHDGRRGHGDCERPRRGGHGPRLRGGAGGPVIP